MDDGPPVEAEFLSESSLDEDGPRNDQYTGAFFPKAHHLVVAGGKFKSITNVTQTAPTAPSDFRMVPMEDLDLHHEICLSGSGIVNRLYRRNSMRRVYSARTHGSKSKMTVAVYQGENAEKGWREDISRYSWLLHPNVVQLYATASRSGIHAAVFHDELIPATQIQEKYRDSHFATVYLCNHLTSEFRDVQQYMDSVFGKSPESWECMLWIRRSTGRLCVELTRPQFDPFFLLTWSMNYISGLTSSLEPPDDSQIIASTPLDVSHGIFALHLGHYRELPISSVQLGVIISCAAGTGIGDSAVIAGILDKMFDDSGWSGNHTELLVMEDGWTRISSSGLEGGTIITRLIWTNYYTRLGWLAQANYLFNRLGITSNYDDYVHVHAIRYQVTLTDTGRIPPGYLCLCPLQDLQSETTSHFWRPACAAYWSLDPSGAEHMSTEEADELGFPRLKFEMWANGWSWDESVYNGIRQFQQAKGYDPYSRDVARELGYPLIHVVSELESFEETESSSGDEDSEQDDGLSSNEADGESGEDYAPTEGVNDCTLSMKAAVTKIKTLEAKLAQAERENADLRRGREDIFSPGSQSAGSPVQRSNHKRKDRSPPAPSYSSAKRQRPNQHDGDSSDSDSNTPGAAHPRASTIQLEQHISDPPTPRNSRGEPPFSAAPSSFARHAPAAPARPAPSLSSAPRTAASSGAPAHAQSSSVPPNSLHGPIQGSQPARNQHDQRGGARGGYARGGDGGRGRGRGGKGKGKGREPPDVADADEDMLPPPFQAEEQQVNVVVGAVVWGHRSLDTMVKFCHRIERDNFGPAPHPFWVSSPDNDGYVIAHFVGGNYQTARENAEAFATAWNSWCPGTQYQYTSASLSD